MNELFTKLGCFGTLVCLFVSALVTTLISYTGIMLGAIPYMIVVAVSFLGTAWFIVTIKNAIGEKKYYEAGEKHVMVSKDSVTASANAGDTQEAASPEYTEEEFQKLPAWKRVELMREKENKQ